MKKLYKVSKYFPQNWMYDESGKIGYAILWLLGVPFPLLAIVYMMRHH